MRRGIKAQITAPTVQQEWRMMLSGFQDMDQELASFFDDEDSIISLNPNRQWRRVNEPVGYIDEYGRTHMPDSQAFEEQLSPAEEGSCYDDVFDRPDNSLGPFDRYRRLRAPERIGSYYDDGM